MKKAILMFIIMVMVIGVSFPETKSVSFFSPGSFYIYIEGGTIGINPYEPYEYGGKEWGTTMIFGAGYTLLNIHNRYKLNFEFDFSNPKYSVFSDYEYFDQRISFANYKLDFEYLFRNGRVSLFSGIGVSNIKYLENEFYHEYSITVMLVEAGLKVALSKNLFLRGEFKFFLDPEENTIDYYDDYYFDFDDDSSPIASVFAIGLELKF